MIKEILEKYENVAFNCHTKEQYLKFIDVATSELYFSKTLSGIFIQETKETILKYYTNRNETIALICKKNRYKRTEFQYYARVKEEFEYYSDWKEFKIFDFVKLQRKQKLQKIKNL